MLIGNYSLTISFIDINIFLGLRPFSNKKIFSYKWLNLPKKSRESCWRTARRMFRWKSTWSRDTRGKTKAVNPGTWTKESEEAASSILGRRSCSEEGKKERNLRILIKLYWIRKNSTIKRFIRNWRRRRKMRRKINLKDFSIK